MKYQLTEKEITDLIIKFLISKKWDKTTLVKSQLHGHGADIDIRKGKSNGERFIIECKKKSNCKSQNIINKECWLNALGQLITRMENKKTISSGLHKGEPNRAIKYGMGLYWKTAQVALRRIPCSVATSLTLHIFSVNEKGVVKHFSPKDFGKTHLDSEFK